MDILALTFEALFEGSLVVAASLLLLTYVAFVRMNKDVRRARMFLMADRIGRFLGAFTVGFLLIAAASVMAIAGLPDAALVFGAVVLLFCAAIVYGSVELFLIVRPRRRPLTPALNRVPVRATFPRPEASADEAAPGGGDRAAR